MYLSQNHRHSSCVRWGIQSVIAGLPRNPHLPCGKKLSIKAHVSRLSFSSLEQLPCTLTPLPATPL